VKKPAWRAGAFFRLAELPLKVSPGSLRLSLRVSSGLLLSSSARLALSTESSLFTSCIVSKYREVFSGTVDGSMSQGREATASGKACKECDSSEVDDRTQVTGEWAVRHGK